MGSYLLPLTINNRRLYSLPLHTENHATATEDFVIELKPDLLKLPLFSIDKNKILQTLHVGRKDIKLSGLKPSIEIIEEKIHLILDHATEKKHEDSGNEDVSNDKRFGTQRTKASSGSMIRIDNIKIGNLEGLEIEFEENDRFYSFFLRNSSGRMHFKLDNKLEIEISYKNGEVRYKNILNLFISPESSFFHFGFDFGSEASQIRQKKYGKNGIGFAEEIKDASLFNLIKDYKGYSNDSKEAFLQHEENTAFFKSIFFAKKSLTGIGQFKDASLLADSEELLILKKSQEADRIFYEQWTQLPNLKIAHKYGEELGNFEFKVTADNIVETKSLQELKETL